MHQNFTHSDIADRYLKGQLSKNEQWAFEEKMRQDPLLASEMALQKDIYQALGETRKAALKNRLDQVSIDHSPWASWQEVKMAAVVGTLLIVGASSYYYFGQSTESVTPLGLGTDAPTKNITYPKAYTLKHAPIEVVPEITAPEDEATTQPEAAIVQKSTTARSETSRVLPTNIAPTIVRPDVVSKFTEDAPTINYSDFKAPEKQTLQGNFYQEEDIAIEALSDSKYDFHYQFYDNKLYLHGDFYGMPYKIIALNTETDKKLFLEFNDTYYHIGEHREVIPLVAIEDSTLVKSLKNLGKVK